jgi:predicted Ser/Thr protein kinase
MSAASRPLPPKLGKYEVRREVGRGGMGIVYEGFDPLINRRVALKTFISEFFDGTQADNLLTRLRREAQAAGRLSHPNIIAVYDYGEEIVKDAQGVETSTAFIAMEFVEGRSLESYCDANERFPMREIERIMSELLDALEYSHSHGVVHRDIKPANVILLADGTVKVADFGVARIESSTLTQVGTVLGSPSYMSPEQFMGQIVDGRSDLYSAGVVLYRLLTAEVPFSGGFTSVMHRVLNDNPPPPSVLNVQVPKGFDAVLRRAMAKRPDDRFQSAGEFKQALLAAKAEAPADDAPPAGVPEDMTVRRPKAASAAAGHRRTLPPRMVVASLAVLIALGLVAYLLWGSRGGAPPQAQLPAAAPTSASNGDYALISAVGVANPADPAYARDSGAAERVLWLDARRQLIAKAAALYVEPSSLNTNYGIVRAKLLQRSDDFIVGAVQQLPPQMTTDGRMLGMIRASVNVRDVQKSLNQISREERIEFIRNNGNPRISVSIRAGTQRSTAAENLLNERIRSFGFVVVDDAAAKPPADFHVDGEVRFKQLSATLPASGLTIQKVVLTSWTVKAVDTKTGEEIYHNTAIPEKQSWATEELALQDVGRLIGDEFTKSFFLQYFDFKPKQARLRISGLPPNIAGAVLAAVDASLVVLNASAVAQDRGDVVIDTQLSGAADSASNLVQQAILDPLNRRIGATCFSLSGADAAEIHILFDAACKSAATLNRLESAPAEALTGAPTSASVRDPRLPNKVST